MLATADPSSWDRTCTEIADRLGTDTNTTLRALHLAVCAWHEDPHAMATQQLNNTRDVRARIEAATRQAPEQWWAPTADQLDPRLTAQEDWVAMAATMQHLSDEGHDVETLARASITDEPLVSSRPAQALRYRLAVFSPATPPGPQAPPQTRTGRRAPARGHPPHHQRRAPEPWRSAPVT